jgi:hypothetical protein
MTCLLKREPKALLGNFVFGCCTFHGMKDERGWEIQTARSGQARNFHNFLRVVETSWPHRKHRTAKHWLGPNLNIQVAKCIRLPST